MNQPKQIKQAQKLARALNYPKGHPKDVEKGRINRALKKRFPAVFGEGWDA